MATQERNPTSDISATGTWSGSSGSRYTLVDDYPDTTADKLTLTGFSGGRIIFGTSAFTVPAGSVIERVEVEYYDSTTAQMKNTVGASLRISGNNYDATDHNLLVSPASRSDVWIQNPDTNLAWDVSTVNAIQGFGFVSTAGNPDVSILSARIKVTYTPPSTDQGLYLETLLRNSVWSNLTLYEFGNAAAGSLTNITERTGQYLQNQSFTNYRNLFGQTGEKAEVVPFVLNGRNVLRFKSTTATRYIKSGEYDITPTPNFGFREAVIVCKYDGATFSGDSVLISDNTSGATLNGDDTTDDFQTTAPTYQVNWQTTTGTPAPMNQFAVIRIQSSTPIEFDELGDRFTLGDLFDGTGVNWKGDVAEIMLFSSTLTQSQRETVKLYNQLKWGLLGMSTPRFPDPTVTGIDYARYYEIPPDYSEVTYSNTYEDGGVSLNESGTPPKRWEVEFNGLSRDEADIFDAFHELVKFVGTFDFVDPSSVTHNLVRIESYDRSHAEHKSWSNTVRFTLTQYPY